MTPELWIATANAKKRLELERLLGPLGYAIRNLADHPTPIGWVEDRPDFAGNAAIKASTVARAVGRPAIGDDSGLEVRALGGAPGVMSARYAGPEASDADRIDKLLAELDGAVDRRARFVCHVCVAAPDGTVLATFEDTCEGVIATAPSGAGGFGYDPVFVPAGAAARAPAPTFAELSAHEKDAISHRGKALRRLRSWLLEHPLNPPQ